MKYRPTNKQGQRPASPARLPRGARPFSEDQPEFSAEGLRLRRTAAGMTQSGLAARVGREAKTIIHTQRVCDWEQSRAVPSAVLLPSIAIVLGCSIAELARVPRLS